MEQGITLTGGGALHYGLASRLSDHLNIAVTIAPSPLEAVVLGNRRILESPELCPILAS
jgi:actin-like ATPase involved in cell morphogenesis